MIQGNIDVAQALEILDLLLEDLNDDNIKKWVKNEINGYSAEESVPKYRKANAEIIGTVKTYTAVISRYNIPIPLEDAKELCVIDIRVGIVLEEPIGLHTICQTQPREISLRVRSPLVQKKEFRTMPPQI